MSAGGPSKHNLGISAGRLAVGLGALAAPGAAGKLMGAELDGPGRLLMRLFGGRDAVLGLGQMLAERHGTARGWYEAGAVVDLIDAGAIAAAMVRGDVKRGYGIAWTVFAILAAAGGLMAARNTSVTDGLDAELAELTAAGLGALED